MHIGTSTSHRMPSSMPSSDPDPCLCCSLLAHSASAVYAYVRVPPFASSCPRFTSCPYPRKGNMPMGREFEDAETNMDRHTNWEYAHGHGHGHGHGRVSCISLHIVSCHVP